MNWTKFSLTAVAVFVFIFFFDWLVHGIFLSGHYLSTASSWRPTGEHLMTWMVISQICQALAFTYLFARKMNKSHLNTQQCVRYGFGLGMLLAAFKIGTYCYLPIPGILVFWWMVAALVSASCIGYITSLTYKK